MAETLLIFTVNGARYGIASERVAAVAEAPGRTRVPGMPKYIAGLAVLRGSLVPVADLCLLMGRAHVGEYRCVVLLRNGGEDVALLADQVLEAVESENALVDAAPPADGAGYVAATLADKTAVLDADKLLAALFGRREV